MLYQLSYEATHRERGQFIEFISIISYNYLLFHISHDYNKLPQCTVKENKGLYYPNMPQWPIPGVQLFGAQREKQHAKKIKKAGWEEAKEGLWANLTKGLSAHFNRPSTETRNMTTGLWFSVFNLSLKHFHGIFQTLSLESQHLET